MTALHMCKYTPEEQALSNELSSGSHRCHPLQDQSMVDAIRVVPEAAEGI